MLAKVGSITAALELYPGRQPTVREVRSARMHHLKHADAIVVQRLYNFAMIDTPEDLTSLHVRSSLLRQLQELQLRL